MASDKEIATPQCLLPAPLYVGHNLPTIYEYESPRPDYMPTHSDSQPRTMFPSTAELTGTSVSVFTGTKNRRDTFGHLRRSSSELELTLAPSTCPRSTVNIIVESGGESQLFTLHTDLIRYYSPYFSNIFSRNEAISSKARIRSKMLRREWRWENKSDIETMEGNGFGDEEGKIEVEVRIKLPAAMRQIRLNTREVGPVSHPVFAAFVDWLYKGFPGCMMYDAETLIQLWVFAGKIGIPELQNDCIENIEFQRTKTNVIQTSALGWVYNNTENYKEGCKLKKLLIDQCAWKLDGNWIACDGMDEESFPRQALVDMVAKMRLLLDERKTGEAIRPEPFSTLELRKKNYWVPVERRSLKEVLAES